MGQPVLLCQTKVAKPTQPMDWLALCWTRGRQAQKVGESAVWLTVLLEAFVTKARFFICGETLPLHKG